MATPPTLDERIESTPGVCGGRPRIAGHRIRVQDIAAWHEFHAMSPDEIVSGYPQITLADVHAALAYYHANRDEIQRQMREDESFVENLRRSDPRTPPKPSGTDAHGNPLLSAECRYQNPLSP